MASNYKKKKRDLSVNDRIALCGVAVMGKDYALEAYRMSHNVKTENQSSLGQMVSRWLNSNKAIEFLNEIKQLYADTLLANADEGEELSERQLTRIIERGIVSEKDAKKQADMSLKLMAWRKDTQEGNEKKSKANYYLPVVSSCKACKIMGFFLEMNRCKEITDQTEPPIMPSHDWGMFQIAFNCLSIKDHTTALFCRVKHDILFGPIRFYGMKQTHRIQMLINI